MTQSSVTISSDVVSTVVRNTVLAMPSVTGLVDKTNALRPKNKYRGVDVELDDGEARVTLHLAAAPDVSLNELGRQIQQEVQAVVAEIIGIHVASVDVYFEDVQA